MARRCHKAEGRIAPTRKERILLLVGARSFEHLPQPKTLSLASKPGPAASDRVPCSCASLRVVIYRDSECCEPGCRKPHSHLRQKQRYELTGNRRCDVCRGDGWRPRLRALDGVATADERNTVFDEYTYGHSHAIATKRARDFGEQPKSTMSERELGLALDRLAAQWPALRDPDQEQRFKESESYGWERARARHFASGSFLELERALDELRLHDEVLHRRFLRNPDTGQALDFLEECMPDPVRVPQHLLDQDRSQRRKQTVAELAAEGRTPRQISRELQIDLRKVKSVMSRMAS